MPEIIFNGPEGRLEGRYTHSKIEDAPLALILHPNPEQGGTMNNKITFMMHQALSQRGFSTLRFNFRGVGKSQGMHERGEGELCDAAAALDWLQSLNQSAPYVWVAGYQFGALMAMQLLMRRPEIKGFIAATPPANEDDFSFLAPCPSSGLIMHGERDNIIPLDSVNSVAERLGAQKGIEVDYRVIEGANHFYRDRVDDLVANIHDYMNNVEHGGLINIDPEQSRAA